jgi:outer membrane protein TolC
VTTENTALQAQLTDVTIQLRRMNASVLLIKALGGGWDIATLDDERRDQGRGGSN